MDSQKIAKPSRDERKKIFAGIMESLKEFSNEEINSTEAREEILQLLKTHRAVKLCDYEYGLSSKLMKDGRLIVKELENKSKVLEYLYAKGPNTWYCSNRSSSRCKCRSSSLRIIHGIVFAPLNHSDACETKEYTKVMEIQDLLKQGKVSEAHGLAVRGGKNRKSTARRSSSSSSEFNESAFSSAGMTNGSILERSVSLNTTTASINCYNTTLFSQKPSSTVSESTTSSARASVKREIMEDDDDCMIIQEPPVKKPKIELPTIELFENENNKGNEEAFEFDRPSSYILKKICKKLKIEYNDNAYKIWVDMIFSNILPRANNIQTHSLKSQNFFACLALLFTGKSNSCFLIQHVISDALREDPTVFCSKSSEEIEQILINIIVYDEQIEFIAKFVECRIGIYYDGILKKFGKWVRNNEEEENILTLLFSFDAGLYSVVLNLL